MTSPLATYAAARAARAERSAVVEMIRTRMSELQHTPHSGSGPVSGGISELGRLLRLLAEREEASAECDHIWQTGAIMEDPLAPPIYECALCGTHISESEMRSLYGDR